MTDNGTLSIIIPVLNWDLGLLLGALIHEIERNGLEDTVKIIIADDCSDEQYRSVNRVLVRDKAYILYYELEQRLGRAAIRNDLLGRVTTGFILFLDADVLPDNSSFLHSYLKHIRQGDTVVCGGISYKTRVLSAEKYNFYFFKGVQTEWLPARERQKVPWRYLFTANVLIKRAILEKVCFNEEFSGYGYEDIEWGIRLEKMAGIHHIDNTCSHLGLVGKNESLVRMRQSINNFIRLRRLHPNIFEQAKVARLVNWLQKVPVLFLHGMDYLLQRIFLLSRFHRLSLFCFQFDKAVLLACAVKKHEKNS